MNFSSKDKEQIEAHGLSFDAIGQQLENFVKGFPATKAVGSAGINNGIEKLEEQTMKQYIELFDRRTDYPETAKFVPASGAASRMFKDLYEFLEKYSPETGKLEDFLAAEQTITHIGEFAFAQELYERLKEKNKTAFHEILSANHFFETPFRCEDKTFHRRLIETILNADGLDYGQSPKALILFHKYKDAVRTAMEEHLVEAAAYCRNKDGKASLHFTVSPAHHDKVRRLLAKVLPHYEQTYNTKFDIKLSFQKSSTDTIAVQLDNTPARNEQGELIFRPAGHGALIENLQETNADIIYIKNIDNVEVDDLKQGDVRYKKMLGGMLVALKRETDTVLQLLQSDKHNTETIVRAEELCKEKLHLHLQDRNNFADNERYADYLFERLNRPMRICSMVKNEGQPGGGPFWVEDRDGEVSLQIVEKAQLNLEDETQNAIFQSSTHFNPVDIVCSIKDYKGDKFRLNDFIDPSAGFISVKTQQSSKIKIQERPGLWNGAMAKWISIFVETPIEYFNPVKTLNDLLKPAHRND